MPQSRRRIPTTLAALVVLGGAGGLCWWGAVAAADFIETRTREEVTLALSVAGQDWVGIATDGLRVHLSGTAPSEVERFRAVTQAATVVDGARIVDEMTVLAAEALTPPEFKIELLRNTDGISLIGLVPAATDRAAILRMLQSETAAPRITDLLESADYAVPDSWDDAIAFGLQAAQMAARAKISIAPGQVQVSAAADSRAEKGRMETALNRLRPESVRLITDISAPRPVITPFTLRFLIDAEGARFDACAADNEDGRARILEAAREAGATGVNDCTLGLGAPTPQWADAAVPAIAAVAELGQGSVTISDADIALSAPATVDQAQFDAVAERLEAALPAVFTLQARKEHGEEAGHGPTEFVAALSGEGNLSMRGRISDEGMREAVDSFARSRFATVQSNLSNDDDVPGGWTLRVIGALEAMDSLASGTVEVSADLISLSGVSGDPDAAERTASALAERLGPGARYDLSIRYDRRLDPALYLPDGEECVRRLNIILSESEIGFEPSKSTIAGDPAVTLERMAAVMGDCAEFRMEAGGHTDSQGSEGFNADLSRTRAQALVAAMAGAGIDTTNVTSRGYGESQPIAGNETEAGREENRRIEFRLLSDLPVRREPLAPPITLSGVTREVPALPAAQDGDEDGDGPPVQIERTAREFAGPPMPTVITGPMIAPLTLGVSEEVEALDAREENIRLPVQTPDENTPRPEPRPADEAGAAQAEGATGTE